MAPGPSGGTPLVPAGELRAEPVTSELWPDLLDLFGANGAYSNCWCTWWLMTGKAWDAATAKQRRTRLHELVTSGEEPGLLAYAGEEAVGWCAVGPRQRYDRFTSPRARVYRTVDDEPSWVVNCFYIPRAWRGAGVATFLLGEAVDFVVRRGGKLVEGYPIDLEAAPTGAAGLFVGSLSMFLHAGFTEVARVNGRPLVRRRLEPTR